MYSQKLTPTCGANAVRETQRRNSPGLARRRNDQADDGYLCGLHEQTQDLLPPSRAGLEEDPRTHPTPRPPPTPQGSWDGVFPPVTHSSLPRAKRHFKSSSTQQVFGCTSKSKNSHRPRKISSFCSEKLGTLRHRTAGGGQSRRGKAADWQS